MKIFQKLFISHLAVTMAALFVASGFTGYKIVSQTRIWMMDQLAAYGQQTAELLRDRDWNSQEMRGLQDTVNSLERGQDARIWLVDRQGQVRVASPSASNAEVRPPARLSPEDWEAVLRGQPVVLRGDPMAPRDRPMPPFERRFGEAVAVPVYRHGEVAGVVVLSPVIQANRWRGGVAPWLLLFYGGLMAALAVAPISAIIARQIARPISLVGQAGQQVARGNFSARVDWKSKDEMGDLADGFNHMAADLDRLESARRELLAHVSHELKGPLARMAGYLEAINDGIGGEEGRREHFRIVRDEVGRLTRLVNDVLDVSRMEAGRLKLRPFPCDLSPYLSRAVAVFASPAESAEIRLDSQIPANLPIVRCEPERVEQVLVNLLQNALAHTPPGGTVTVRAQEDGKDLTVTVADTGPGIPAEELTHIWERFHKIDRARTPDKGGSGLGLTIVRQLVELQGGQVWVQSTVGEGSTFGFRLPIATPEL